MDARSKRSATKSATHELVGLFTQVLGRKQAAEKLLAFSGVLGVMAVSVSSRAGREASTQPSIWRELVINVDMAQGCGFECTVIKKRLPLWKDAFKFLHLCQVTRRRSPSTMSALMPLLHPFTTAALGDMPPTGGFVCEGLDSRSDPKLFAPSLEMSLELPLDPAKLRRLISNKAERAPLGKGMETVVDLDARKTWRIALGGDVLTTSGAWNAMLSSSGGDSSILDSIKRELAPSLFGRGEVVAQPYQLLIYEEGDFFAPHKDTVRAPTHFGSLVVSLPVAGGANGGGKLRLCHAGEEHTAATAADGTSNIAWTAFYTDVVHEVEKVTSGLRVTLTYHLHAALASTTAPPRALPAMASDESSDESCVMLLGSLLRFLSQIAEWMSVTYALEHEYTTQTLRPEGLHGNDAMMLTMLTKALTPVSPASPDDGNDDNDNDYDTESDIYAMVPVVSLELLQIRDFFKPKEGKEPVFNVGRLEDQEWYSQEQCMEMEMGGFSGFVNKTLLVQRLAASTPDGFEIYTGNEGMETGYVYTPAVIKIEAVHFT